MSLFILSSKNVKRRLPLGFLLAFMLSSGLMAQEQVNLRDFVRLNDIGIKIIDQKALKKHLAELELDKAQKKLFLQDVKKQKKELKPELKEYNKVVYERRRLEETSVRMGSGSDSSNVPYTQKIKESKESIHAKKEELVFNKKEILEEELIPEKAKSSLIPNRREKFPWSKKLKPDCGIISFVDPIYKDTTLEMKSKIVYDNYSNFLRSEDQPLATCKLALLRERDVNYIVVEWKETSIIPQAIWRLSEDDLLTIVLEDGSSFDLPYIGVERSAICNKDQSIQLFKAKYSLHTVQLNNLLISPLMELSILSEQRQITIPIGKRWIDKAEDWKPVEFFLNYIPCFN